ncbi:MAG: hypothetical protein JWN39_4266 [Ilumatobacteraceae bacterium]|nr:hypothetical protein [Ilumatobacteraceae bacterium]
MTGVMPRGSKDSTFGTPFIDVDEWRDAPVRHRFVHGGFEGGDTRFSMYFPPAEQYEGRFFQPVLPMSGIEFAASIGVLYGIAGSIEFAVDSGAYLVESNLGRPNPFPGDDPSMAGFRASAAVARYSRELAGEMYGDHRPYGYVYGGSGGAFKTLSCVESTNDVWDGAVPFVMGTPMSMPNVFSVQAHAIRLLSGKFADIVDAVEPGGSGDMYAGHSFEQRQALAEVTKMGCPPRSWFDVDRVARGYTAVWSVLADSIIKADTSYFDDFWTVPGYLGADAPASLEAARVQHKTVVTEVLYGEQAAALGLPMPMAMPRGTKGGEIPAALRVADVPDGNILGATVEITTGTSAGLKMYVVGVVDDIILTGVGEAHFESSGGIAAGDDVLVDNSIYLAFQTYHRHQVHPAFPVWDQFLAGGAPIYPQRPKVIGPGMAFQGAGSLQSGRFACKMIVVQTLMDEAAFPCQAVWYRGLVESALGDRIDDQYRLWFVDHAMHTSAEPVAGLVMADTTPSRRTRMVNYLGVLQQALRDVAAWVEHGVAPPPSTNFELADGQISVPDSAEERHGIQAVVHLSTPQGVRAHAAVGEDVEFTASVEVPFGGGTIVAAEWDFDGLGNYPVTSTGIDGALDRAVLTMSHAYAEPGTHFATVRITSHRNGDMNSPHARVQNIARARVIVGAR